MSRSAAVLLVLAVLLLSVLTACGSDDSGGSSTADKAAAPSAQPSTQTTTPAAATSAETTTQVAATPKNNATAVTQCHAAFDPYLTMLHGIRGTVDGAPQFKAYITKVDAMVKDYSNNVNDITTASVSCQKSVLGPLTGSYIKYYNASLTWRECRKRKRCAAAMADLKKQWKEAGTFLQTAEKGFKSVTAR